MNSEQLAQINTFLAALSSVGIFIAAWQLRVTKRQTITTFEDNIAREYRDLANRLPTEALLGEDLSDVEYEKSFDEFYHYFDLSNEQAFLRQRRRISRETWKNWRDGIQSNLHRPAFARAWAEISERSNGDFSELRRQIAIGFKDDSRQ